MRYSVRQNLVERIEKNNNFEIYDFNISYWSNNAEVVYSFNEKGYGFTFHLPNKRSEKTVSKNSNFSPVPQSVTKRVYEVNGTMKPGKYVNEEKFTENSIEEVYGLFSNWLDYLHDDLMNAHIQRQFDERDIEIEKIRESIESVINDNDRTVEQVDFTNEEIDKLKEKLNEMEKHIKENIERLEIDSLKKDEEIQKLRNEFDKFRSTTSTLSKQKWLKRFLYGVTSWSLNPDNRYKIIAGSKLMLGICKFANIELPPEVITLLPLPDDEN